MAKSISDNSNKKRAGRPRVGAILIGVRVPPAGVAELDNWIKKHAPSLSRPEAIRRLVEIGLRSKPAGQPSAKGAEKAKYLAAKTIDQLVDPAAPAEEKAIRKRKLLKGPEEFREVRVDRVKAKAK